ncbi:hypothetical protein Pmi06nite_37150 [Planotetraspora mira]|uniref:Uncharacterized protein n=1 Tax=Planotetraspora mira TaxID=58121 RepID=A0A8J3XB85_9ACTN|nr:hypothetical protein Pmi06nite_37150 [Planotetraspora mira]
MPDDVPCAGRVIPVRAPTRNDLVVSIDSVNLLRSGRDQAMEAASPASGRARALLGR